MRKNRGKRASGEPSSTDDELASLRERFSLPREFVHVLGKVDFGPLDRKRVAEVAMAIRRPNGQILLQTKGFYPDGLFRIPTGGLKRGEAIERALVRETAEETALDVRIEQFVAILEYRSNANETVFHSYLFLLDEIGGTLLWEEPGEGITGWVEAGAAELALMAGRLRNAPRDWRDWGSFRALAIDALLPALG